MGSGHIRYSYTFGTIRTEPGGISTRYKVQNPARSRSWATDRMPLTLMLSTGSSLH